MRIVIATPFYPPQPGVLALYAAGLEEAFVREGHEVRILAPSRGPVGVRHLLYFARMFAALGGASFVLALDTWSVGVPASAAARLRGVPFLVRVGGDHLWEQYLERTHEPVRLSEFYAASRRFSFRERIVRHLISRLLSSAHAVMFNTAFQKELWTQAYRIPHASVLENFYPEKRHADIPHDRVFVSAHRGAWYKNGSTAEAAMARVRERHPEVILDTRVVPHEEQLGRLAASYAVIIPSISEVGSNTAIEAVAAGRPFIMSDDTGTKERLAECGIFVDTRSAEALAQAVETLLDPDAYERYAAKVRAFGFTRSWTDIAREILAQVRG